MMNNIVSEIVDVLLSLLEGTEIATSDVIKQLYGHEYLTCGEYEILGEMYGFEDFFEIDARVHKQAKKRGLILDDSKYDGMATGLPFHIPFVVRRKHREVCMKKYSDKELQAMSAEELQAVREQAMHEFAEAGEELTAVLRKEELLKQISNDEKYRYRVFWGPGIYFVIVNGGIKTISDDASCSPRGGWFPAIVTGPTEEEKECLQGLMDALDFDETFFSELIEDCGEFDEDYVEDFFTDNDDEESLKIYRKVERKVKSGKTPFETMEQLVSAIARFELDDDLYYEWEGEYIHFFNNICDYGEAPGNYDNISTAGWVEILENLDSHVVTAD